MRALLTLAGLIAGAAAIHARPPSPGPLPPQALYGPLFREVQEAHLYPDDKAFPDALPRESPARILTQYRREAPRSREALQAFVQRYFIAVPEAPVPPPEAAGTPLATHIGRLWDVLTRSTPVAPAGSSLLPVPEPYVVPGGRFREMYYWDSYFTMLGLRESVRRDLMQSMTADFAHLIDTYGHIPNGLRSYYLSRSQPPFFFEMVRLLSPQDPAAAWARYLPQLKREHAWWMAGEAGLKPGQARAHVVALPDGAILNRYWDALDVPRDESYATDTALSRGAAPPGLYRDLRAAAESGWDFSSRWLRDGRTRATIQTTQIVPVDLNSLLYGLEEAIRAGCARRHEPACAREFGRRSRRRRAAMDRHLWNAAAGVYFDERWTARTPVPRVTAAALYPLFERVASPAQAAGVARAVSRDLLKAGGLVTTPVVTGEQWDAPNGWAPLQWIAVEGLRRYGHGALAETIACRWLVTVRQLYETSGRLVEKYDVVNGRSGGGGEYPTQDGFGWTNGVTLRLMSLYPADAAFTRTEQCPAPP